MYKHPTALESVEALYLARIVAHQEEIIKMLAQVIANDDGIERDRKYMEHIHASAKLVPTLVNDFLNRVQKAGADHTPSQ